MFWTFILGIIAGWVAPFAEDRLRQPLETYLSDGKPLAAADLRAISLIICLLIAVIVAARRTRAHALPLILGAAIGVVGPRLLEKFRAMRAPDYDS